MDNNIVCFGPGPQFKGGISNYNTSLAKALDRRGDARVHIVSWTRQYPAIIPREFRDLKSRQDLIEGTGISVKYITDYNNPLTWKRTVDYIRSLKPSKVIFQWSIALQGLPLGYIAGKLKRDSETEVIFDLHFVVQKENSSIDRLLTKRAIGKADSYIVHALKTLNELSSLFPDRKFTVTDDGRRDTKSGQAVIKLFHPIYDLFSIDPAFDRGAFRSKHRLRNHVFLFFGFIRKYKGLHNVIRAFALLAKERDDVSLIICGESFWKTLDSRKLSTKLKRGLFGLAKKLFLKKADDESGYNPLELVDQLNIRERCMIVNDFIPNEDVHQYFQASDCALLFYEYATPSGIESLSYNFRLPIIATAVGHFPETIRDGFNGYLAKAGDLEDMKSKMALFISNPPPRENIDAISAKMSWERYAAAIMENSLRSPSR